MTHSANTQMEDLGAKPAAAMLRKASHNNPSPSNAEGEISRHQEVQSAVCVPCMAAGERDLLPFTASVWRGDTADGGCVVSEEQEG